MDADRWTLVQRILNEALEADRARRDAFLDNACGSDAALRAEVESLLAAHNEDPHFLEHPIARLDGAGMDADMEPRSIGPYRVIRPLGEGGMGQVLLARQETQEFARTVAVKVIKRGMDTDELLRRFAQERRILARLVHPNIAQLHDAGATDDGRPYFVMEFVDGVRVDRWVERQRLPVPERLRLFQSICSAVHHAHQNLVVHRDIKPGNVLITAYGVPKLVDFGIGKVLSEDGSGRADTRTTARALTPEYAAPEQLRGESVTTAADVFGLGALLFQILTGERPRMGASPDRDAGPPRRPSATVAGSEELSVAERARRSRQLSGDLDNIVLKAMHETPERRYGSAAELSEDIERHLTGRPILARPDTFGYRASKFVRRNRWSVATTLAVAAGLVAVTITTVVQSRLVVAERDKAREVQSFLLETFGSTAADGVRGDSVTVRQLLDAQAAGVDAAYGSDPELRAAMLAVLADAYERLGLYDEAEEMARDALEARRGLFGPSHREVAASLNLLGWIRHQQGASVEAAELLEAAVAAWRSIGGGEREGLARALNDLGSVLDRLGRDEEAEQHLAESLKIRRSVSGPLDRAVAVTSSNLAVLAYNRGDYAGADSLGQAALDALRSTVGPAHQRTVVAQSNLAVFRLAAGDEEGAARLHRDLLEQQTISQGRRHPRTVAAMVGYASFHLRPGGDLEIAEALLTEALGVQEEILDPGHPDTGNSLRLLGTAVLRGGRPEEGLRHLRRAEDIYTSTYGERHRLVAETKAAIALAYERTGQRDRAASEYRDMVRLFDATLGSSHPRSIDGRLRLARALVGVGAGAEALPVLQSAYAAAMERRDDQPDLLASAGIELAEAHLEAGRLTAADSIAAALRELLGEIDARDLAERLAHLEARLDSIRG